MYKEIKREKWVFALTSIPDKNRKVERIISVDEIIIPNLKFPRVYFF